ncbi:MAG TPA: RseA family anti-sigma factor [Steroidobacteraceae bacterium]
MNEELDSQLSAMFDNELPAAECELLARRLSRELQLKARWGRYAVIGATIRAEGGARLDAGLARRVNAVVSAEPTFLARPARQSANQLPRRWRRPLAGIAVAASVAAASIFWLRFQGTPQQTTTLVDASGPASTTQDEHLMSASLGSPGSYVIPKRAVRRSIVPATQLANYVVAHSEFSSPLNRRNLLSALMAAESGTAGLSSGSEEPTEDVYDDAKSAQ